MIVDVRNHDGDDLTSGRDNCHFVGVVERNRQENENLPKRAAKRYQDDLPH